MALLVWREIKVPGACAVWDLHVVIQNAVLDAAPQFFGFLTARFFTARLRAVFFLAGRFAAFLRSSKASVRQSQ